MLELAADPDEPLLERVKFCASSRPTSTSSSWCALPACSTRSSPGSSVRSPDGRTPQQTLAEIRERVLELTAAQSRLWRDELCPALAAEGIVVGTVDDATDEELRELEEHLRAADLSRC